MGILPYPNGCGKESLDKLKEPMSEEDKRVHQYRSLRGAAHEYFCTRNSENGNRPPLHIHSQPLIPVLPYETKLTGSMLVIALLVTEEKHRRQGTGGLLGRCGLEKQEETSLSSYLQASEAGRRLYCHYGF